MLSYLLGLMSLNGYFCLPQQIAQPELRGTESRILTKEEKFEQRWQKEHFDRYGVEEYPIPFIDEDSCDEATREMLLREGQLLARLGTDPDGPEAALCKLKHHRKHMYFRLSRTK